MFVFCQIQWYQVSDTAALTQQPSITSIWVLKKIFCSAVINRVNNNNTALCRALRLHPQVEHSEVRVDTGTAGRRRGSGGAEDNLYLCLTNKMCYSD